MAWKLSFLAASDRTPLAKHYALRDGALTKSSYPNVFYFDSYTESLRSLADFARVVTEHAAQGHCLLKGELQRPLRHESRANSTASLTPTNWIALDFDGVPGVTSFEDLLPHLPAYFRDVGYVEQLSASAGIEPGKGYSAHVFMLLDTEIPPPQLKEWLTHLNLTTPVLRSAIRLNNAKTVLRWPLDLTTCQNDKLLYIAPPILGEGVAEQFCDERIRYVRRREATLNISFAPIDTEHNRAETIKLLTSLREAAGLPARRFSLVKHPSGVQILKDAGVTPVTGWKRERGFCYLNLNGGDSWGYYHAEDKPEILFNFKGEPNYAIRDFLPDYYPQALELAQALKEAQKDAEREAKKQAKNEERKTKRDAHRARIEEAQETAHETGLHFIAVEDMRSGAYYRGTFDAATDTLDIGEARAERRLHAFLAQHGQPIPEHTPIWHVRHDFDSDTIFDPNNRTLNLYRRSEYIRSPVRSDEVPPTILRLIRHALGYDEACVEHFLNWLACIVQHRDRTRSAWVLSGTQGTGKGALVSGILAPLLGYEQVCEIDLATLQSDFNGFLEGKLLVLIDESEVSDLRERRKVMARLKRLITEERIQINRKGLNQYMAQNRANFILASNTHDPVDVAGEDRRFSVAPRQEQKILADWGGPMTLEELTSGVRQELHEFAGYLLAYSVDAKRASLPIHTEERERLKELSTTSAQEIADALKRGDLNYFFHNWPGSDDRVPLELETDVRGAPSYAEILDEAFASLGQPTNIPAHHLRALFYYLEGSGQPRLSKFTKYVGHRGLQIKQVRYKGQNLRGLHAVTWRATPELVAAWQQERIRRIHQPPTLRRIK